MTKKTTENPEEEKKIIKKEVEENKGITVPDGVDQEAFIESIMAGGSSESQEIYINFKKGIMQVRSGQNAKEVSSISGARVVFLTQKYDVQEMYDKKERKIRSVYTTSEMFVNKKVPSYIYKWEYIDGERKLKDTIEINDMQDAKSIITGIIEKNPNYKKQWYNVLYIEDSEGCLMKCYLRYTQMGGKGDLINPEEKTFGFWKNTQRDYYKNLFTIKPATNEEGEFTITYPILELEKKVNDPNIFKKVISIGNDICLKEKKVFQEKETETEGDIPEEILPF